LCKWRHSETYEFNFVLWQSELYVFVPELRLLSINQVEGIHSGGSLLYLAVDDIQHARAVACRFGTIAPVRAKAGAYTRPLFTST
jgi:hypothetical protein